MKTTERKSVFIKHWYKANLSILVWIFFSSLIYLFIYCQQIINGKHYPPLSDTKERAVSRKESASLPNNNLFKINKHETNLQLQGMGFLHRHATYHNVAVSTNRHIHPQAYTEKRTLDSLGTTNLSLFWEDNAETHPTGPPCCPMYGMWWKKCMPTHWKYRYIGNNWNLKKVSSASHKCSQY